MSGMTLGSMIEADRRLREHEVSVRQAKKIQRDAAVWRRYEQEYERRGVAGVGSDSTTAQSSGGGSTEN